ncbi:ankyrin repeat domain-containing protein [Leptothoe kymatousa]|uniref:Ankyrin repeat domain-containing protein n=1 Tax=Leptothoe kymatousa TAU-MAC 1615 TaxID=2364775 RepID=A0ABS5Y2V3_9CYAN|nr:ankyrin repeat domain-containing protein [Leptothoe kymatousa]MBT9312173.1 ankyrin repeat domain-containing protein [Leptothoe kymatousa TAU-MAC 1615]
MKDFLKLDQSPIHYAAALGDRGAIADLLSTGADINARLDAAEGWGIFYLGVTPLMVAACSPYGATVETLRWLLDHGADATLPATGKITAAWYAAGAGIFMDLAADIDPADHGARLRLLLSLGADPNETADNGRSLLIEACRTGDSGRVALLLEYGAAVEPLLDAVADDYKRFWAEGCSPLSSYQIPFFNAVSSGSVDCVQRLMDAGVDIHGRSNDGATALMCARHSAVVQMLLDAGLDMNILRKQGWAAFQEILEQYGEDEDEEAEIVRSLQLLIHHGADINATQRGKSRLYYAAFAQNPFAIQRLLHLGATLTADCLGAITWHGNADFEPDIARAIDLLVAAGADIHAQDAAGDTLLHNATLEYAFPPSDENYFGSSDGCNYTAVHCLLRHGIDPDPVGTHGRTPLMLAAISASADTLRDLLAAGANPQRQDAAGQTAVDMARRAYAELQSQADEYTTPKERQSYHTYLQSRAACLEVLTNAALPPQ